MVLRPPTERVIDRGGILARPITVKPVEDKIRKSMSKKMADQLGIEELPAEMKTAVDAAAAGAAQQVVELGLVKVAEEAARDVSRANLLDRFDDKLQLAAAGIAHLGQSSQVDTVLKNRAELLAKKKQSLVTAGFTDGEAMQIILSDIAARGH